MKLGMYVVHDLRCGYMSPFFEVNDDVALRKFASIVNSPGMIADNPEDFALWRVGEFDADKGILNDTDKQRIAEASYLVRRLNNV